MTLINRVQAYWDARPCNIRHSNAPVGTKGYFDEVDARRYFVEPHIIEFAQFERWFDKYVLEVGCGIGTDAVQFARAGARVTAVDISTVSLAICRQRFSTYGLKARRFYQVDIETMGDVVPIEPYDLIYAFGVLHHTPDPLQALRQLRRYTNDHTELRLMLYAKWSWKVLVDILLKRGYGAFWRLAELVPQHSEAAFGSPVSYCYSAAEAKALVESAGFEVVSLEKRHIFPYAVDKYVRYQYECTWYFKLMPKWLFSWLERQLGWHLLIVARRGG